MANLIVSSVCNQHCAYCFASGRFERDEPPQAVATTSAFLSQDSFQNRLDFLTRSNLDEVRLLGGEPTLHPEFDALVARALRAAKRLTVFTNGLMPPAALSCLAALPREKCQVIVNVNAPPAGGSDALYRRQEEALSQLGARARPGFNIYRTDFCPDFLLHLIAETGCAPAIRIGMAHPSLSGTNRHLQPGQYRAVAARLVPFVKKAAGAGIRVGFDCGFVRCMFSHAELDDLAAAEADFGWRCSPVLDVDLDDRVFYCFPLASLAALPFTPGTDASTLYSELEEHARPYRTAGVYRECSTCGFKAAGECSGGCLAVTIRRFRSTPFRLEVPGLATPHSATEPGSRRANLPTRHAGHLVPDLSGPGGGGG